MNTQPIVLMYHGIVGDAASLPEEREEGAELYDVRAKNFRAQIAHLKEHSYRTITVAKNLEAFSRQEIMITFDDGEMNNYTDAFPVLREAGFLGHFFLIAKRVGKDGYMGWKEIKELYDAGMVIGSHGFSHEILTGLQETQIEEELSASKKYLERNLGIEITSLSIPRGFCNNRILEMARAAGYRDIFISDPSPELQGSYFYRVAVKGNWDIRRFEQAIQGEVPRGERIFDLCKNSVKRVGGERVYSWVRKVLLRIK